MNRDLINQERELLIGAYRDFNARRLEAILVRLHPDVIWPNGMEGSYVQGHQAVREYWTQQWGMIDPHVDPLRIDVDADGRFIVEVHQVVHDLKGNLLLDAIVHHAYHIRDRLITRMDIE